MFEISTILMGIVAIILLDVLSLSFRILTLSGAAAASVIGLLVFFFGGWQWFVLLLIFLVVSSLFTKFKYSYKHALGAAQEKKGARSWVNVMANGFVSAIFALGNSFLPHEIMLSGFIGAVSAAFADTLSTEVGILNPSPPRLITNLKKEVPIGTSGGVSILGELSILLSTAILALAVSALSLGSFSFVRILFIVAVSGFWGSTIDSVLGATYQARYRCTICGKIIESREHCGKPAQYLKGIGALDNNGVNFIATGIGALTGILSRLLKF